MPPRINPTARQERLGTELRRMREAAGVTAREVARLLGIDQAKISHIEAGRIGVSEERVRRLAAHYSCPDGAYVDALVAMATERGKGWWEEYRGVLPDRALDLAELEHHAVHMRYLQIVRPPGLLQTEDYIRALFSYAVPEPTPDQLDTGVAFRLRRHRVLEGESPTSLEAVIHEAALRIRVAGRDVARRQLDFLLEQSERPHITVRVIPMTADHFGGAGYSMHYVCGPVLQLDTVLLDTVHPTWLDEESQLTTHRAMLDKTAGMALDPDESRELIHGIAREV